MPSSHLKNHKARSIGKPAAKLGLAKLKSLWLDSQGGRDESDVLTDQTGEYVWMQGKKKKVKVYLPDFSKWEAWMNSIDDVRVRRKYSIINKTKVVFSNQKFNLMTPNKYKVLVKYDLDDQTHEVDSVVTYLEEKAAPLIAEGKLELVETV